MVKRILPRIIGIIIIFFLITSPKWGEVFQELMKIPRSLFLSLFLLQILSILLMAYLWYLIVKKEIPFYQVLAIYLTGSFVESVTPGMKIGGEMVKFYLLKEYSSFSKKELLSLFLAQKYITLFPFILIYGLGLLFSFKYPLPVIFYGAFLAFLLLFYLVFFYNKNSLFLSSTLKKLSSARKGWQESIPSQTQRKLLLISTSIWLLYPVKIYLVALNLGAVTGPIHTLISTFSAYLVSMIPFLPGGVGTFEGSLAYLFTRRTNPYELGLAISLTARLFTFFLPLIFSAIITFFLLAKQPLFKSIKGGLH